jgi:hypothetical protein
MTRERAVELAQEVARREGWPWIEPIRATRFRRWWVGPITWEVVSNADKRGMNVRIVIDGSSGRILEKRFLPR